MKFKNGITTALILLALLLVLSTSQADAVMYKSYIYDGWGLDVPTPHPYLPVQVIHGKDLGLTALNNPQDLFVASDNTLYIVDSGNNRIIRTDDQFQVLNIYDNFERDGQIDTFNNPQGIFITPTGHMFIADRDNARIVRLDEHGEFVMQISEPESDIPGAFPDHFRFRPRKVAVDPANRVYIIADGLYEGLLELDIDGNFRGFVGAPRVSPNPIDWFWSMIASDEQRQRMRLFLPTEYSNMDLDDRGFIYTTVRSGGAHADQRIRRLNPSGMDILTREGTTTPMGDIHAPQWGTSIVGESVLVDIVSRPGNMYSVLDSKRGRIFTYDGSGNLLYIFGGIGHGIGLTLNPISLTAIGEQLLVLDNRAGRITVFDPTEYALLIHEAIYYYNRGRYHQATEAWKQVLMRNANYELAYNGIATAYLRQNAYEEAMANFYLGNNRSGYSDAFERYRRERIGDNFGTIMTVILLSVLGIFLAYRFKLGTILSRKWSNTEVAATISSDRVQNNRVFAYCKTTFGALWYAIHVIFHPYDGFWDLKFEKRGTTSAATILLGLVITSFVFMRQYTGFILNYNRPEHLNIIVEITSIVLPFMLWVLVNWALTTLMEGKGTIKDIYLATAYSLTPLILINIPATILSNYITVAEVSFFAFFISLAVFWSMGLMVLGTSITHDYDMTKTVLTIFAIIVGMGTVLFVGLLFFNVIDRMLRFIQEIYTEFAFRL